VYTLSRRTRPATIASRQAVVERAEAFVQAHLDQPVRLAGLCPLLGVSERTLRNAFYGVRGAGPKRSLLAARLHGVRLALSAEHSAPITVTQIATRHGFSDLGRFAAAYRHAFGETPSETLHASRSHTCLPLPVDSHKGR
jgi:AraC-like DNA-binding protein